MRVNMSLLQRILIGSFVRSSGAEWLLYWTRLLMRSSDARELHCWAVADSCLGKHAPHDHAHCARMA